LKLFKSLLLALIMTLCILPAAPAAPPAAAMVEINHLLGLMEQSGCEFYRNGTWYDAQRAQEHLRAKFEALAAKDQIKTAEDFIDKAASNSSISGQPYQIKCGASAAISTSQWFSAALEQYRKHQ
jgi:hypothetical protein